MFFGKKSTTTNAAASAVQEDLCRAASPVDSVMSQNKSTVVPLPALQTGFPDRLHRPSPNLSLVSFTNASPTVDLVSGDLVQKNAALVLKKTALETQIEEIKLVSDVNRDMLQKCGDQLVNKIDECEAHRQFIKEKEARLSTLQDRLDSSENFHKEVLRERDQLQQDLTAKANELASLRQKNTDLVSRVNLAENLVKRNILLIDVLQKQLQDFTLLHDEDYQKHKSEIDTMHARQPQAQKYGHAELQTKEVAIQHLRTRLANSTRGKLVIAQDFVIQDPRHDRRNTNKLD